MLSFLFTAVYAVICLLLLVVVLMQKLFVKGLIEQEK